MAFLVKFFAFILAWACVKGSSIRKDKILFLQESSGEKNEILLVMTWTENEGDMTAGCEIFTNEGLINEILAFNDSQIRKLPEDDMQILLGDCLEFNHRRRKRDANCTASAGVLTEDDYEDDPQHDYDELSNTNRRRSYGRRGSRNRTSYKRRKEKGSKSNNTITASDPSTTVSLNEITNEHDKRNRGPESRNRELESRNRKLESRNRTSANREIERESEESTDNVITTKIEPSVTEPSTTEPSTTLGYDGMPIVFPGTKWCGAGDIAENYDDLGRYADTDRCCRAHDHCNDTLAPGETRNNLTNASSFTKLSCQCDNEFFDCLYKIRSMPAYTVGNMYFNILRRDCYVMDYPPSNSCKKYRSFLKLTCSEYKKDTSKGKVYQWVKPKTFLKILSNFQ